VRRDDTLGIDSSFEREILSPAMGEDGEAILRPNDPGITTARVEGQRRQAEGRDETFTIRRDDARGETQQEQQEERNRREQAAQEWGWIPPIISDSSSGRERQARARRVARRIQEGESLTDLVFSPVRGTPNITSSSHQGRTTEEDAANTTPREPFVTPAETPTAREWPPRVDFRRSPGSSEPGPPAQASTPRRDATRRRRAVRRRREESGATPKYRDGGSKSSNGS
jgi:hypothetical protein